MIWLVLALCLLVAATATLSVLGARRWQASVLALTNRLEAGHDDGTTGRHFPSSFDARELEGLPAPVQRYFRAVLTNGQPIIAAATLEMQGRFNLSTTKEQWKPFTSRQRVMVRRPGFLWDARIALAPGLAVRVVDCYIAGEGLLHAAILGLFTVARLQGDGEVARGELMRFFSEAVWYPTALLPSQGVWWEGVDEHSAKASIADGPLALTLLFRFDDAGLVSSVHADARGGMVGDRVVMMPWECTLSNYQVRDLIKVPMTGEAAWRHPDGRRPYFRGTITTLHHEFAG